MQSPSKLAEALAKVDELLEALKSGALVASGPSAPAQAVAPAAKPPAAAPAAPAASGKQGKKEKVKKNNAAAAPGGGAAAEGDAFSKAHLVVRVCEGGTG